MWFLRGACCRMSKIATTGGFIVVATAVLHRGQGCCDVGGNLALAAVEKVRQRNV